MTDYLSVANSRVGNANNTGFFSASKRLIYLQRARRAVNSDEDVCIAI
jgi:hypothetical protein